MVEKLPTQYRKSSEAVATFSFEDIASGLGVIVFFGIATNASGGVNYHLISNSDVFSFPVGTERATVGTTSIDFDTSAFNLPRTPRGTAFFSAGTWGENSFAGDMRLDVQLFHVTSGGTETALSSKISSAVPADATSEMVSLELPITTEKIIKNGEVLRLTVDLVQINAAAHVEVGHDPKNQPFMGIQPGTKDSSVMTLLMPFKLPI